MKSACAVGAENVWIIYIYTLSKHAAYAVLLFTEKKPKSALHSRGIRVGSHSLRAN